jgi:hypothetical protein
MQNDWQLHAQLPATFDLELYEESSRYSILAVAKIGTPARDDRSQSTSIASRRRDASRAGKVWHVRRTMVVLQTISEVLARHIVCRH